jgi:hypothetical protein
LSKNSDPHNPQMKLHEVKSEPQNRRMSNVECRRAESLRSVFFKIDRSTQKLTAGRIHYFDIRHSSFDIRFFKVSFSIRLAAIQASGGAEP